MKAFLLILFLCVAVAAQVKETSVCPAAVEDDSAILVICNKGIGMVPLPPVRLYLRLYEDGTAEYEENPTLEESSKANYTLITRKMKIDAAKLAEIKKHIAAEDFQKAKGNYPSYRIWIDSGLETTLVARTDGKTKKIVLKNYSLNDEVNKKNYSASLNALLKLTGVNWNQKSLAEPSFIEYKGGALVVGKTYRGKVNFGDAYGMRLTVTPKLPYHHSVMYNWANVKDFPALDPDKGYGARTIVFKVADKEVENIDRNRWTTSFKMEIARVEDSK